MHYLQHSSESYNAKMFGNVCLVIVLFLSKNPAINKKLRQLGIRLIDRG